MFDDIFPIEFCCYFDEMDAGSPSSMLSSKNWTDNKTKMCRLERKKWINM